MADLATELSNIPPTFLRNFLSPEEGDTLFMNDLEEEFFFSFLRNYSSSWCKLAKMAHYFELTVPCYNCDGIRNHFRIKPMTIDLLTNLLSRSEHIHLVGSPLNKENR